MAGDRPTHRDHAGLSTRRGHARLVLAACLVCLALGGPLATAAQARTSALSFPAEADAYVDSAAPATSYGGSSSLWIDASSVKQSFLRFRVQGLGGRRVMRARLRLYQRDASPAGGRVHSISSESWTESLTYATRPAIDGPERGSFGSVQAGRYYELDLGSFITSDGVASLAIVSSSSDGALWGSRESSNPPQLILDVEDSGSGVDGLSEVADPLAGSSDPTYLGLNHRLAVTEAGRLLAVHGKHATGVQLRWRDPGGNWQSRSIGRSLEGLLLSGTGTGDWPASIAVARDSLGREHAWAVWGRTSSGYLKPVQMARISDLDAPDGPSVGPLQTVDAPLLGASKPDIAFERTAAGSMRGCIVWSRRSASAAYDIVTTWFSDLDSDAPAIHDTGVVYTSTTSSRYGTLAPTPAGMRIVARGASGRTTIFSRRADLPLASWQAGKGGVATSGYPSAAALDTGGLLTVSETNTTSNVVAVQRFSPSGAPAPVELQLSGYSQPTIATDGTSAWVVMVRKADGYVVSRQLTPGSGWSATDRVEIGAEGGGNHAYPNALRQADGRLRFLVRGRSTVSSRSATLAFQRPL